eukprot:3861663-Pyramimonas_sp.AAC.1
MPFPLLVSASIWSINFGVDIGRADVGRCAGRPACRFAVAELGLRAISLSARHRRLIELHVAAAARADSRIAIGAGVS